MASLLGSNPSRPNGFPNRIRTCGAPPRTLESSCGSLWGGPKEPTDSQSSRSKGFTKKAALGATQSSHSAANILTRRAAEVATPHRRWSTQPPWGLSSMESAARLCPGRSRLRVSLQRRRRPSRTPCEQRTDRGSFGRNNFDDVTPCNFTQCAMKRATTPSARCFPDSMLCDCISARHCSCPGSAGDIEARAANSFIASRSDAASNQCYCAAVRGARPRPKVGRRGATGRPFCRS